MKHFAIAKGFKIELYADDRASRSSRILYRCSSTRRAACGSLRGRLIQNGSRASR